MTRKLWLVKLLFACTPFATLLVAPSISLAELCPEIDQAGGKRVTTAGEIREIEASPEGIFLKSKECEFGIVAESKLMQGNCRIGAGFVATGSLESCDKAGAPKGCLNRSGAAFIAENLLCGTDPTASVAVQMPPDESTWNAIKDGKAKEPFELFVMAFPQSRFASEAREKLNNILKSPGKIDTAQPSSSSKIDNSTVQESSKVSSVKELLANLGLPVEDVGSIESSTRTYLFMVGLYDENEIKPEELPRLRRYAQVATVVRKFGFDRYGVSRVFEKAKLVYSTLSGNKDPVDDADVFSKLQELYGFSATGVLDEALLMKIADEQMTQSFGLSTKKDGKYEYIQTGDWVFNYPDTSYSKVCAILLKEKAIVSGKTIFTWISPRLAHILEEDKTAIRVIISHDGVFDKNKPVFLKMPGGNIQLSFQDGEFYPPDAKFGDVIRFFSRTSAPITVTGTSLLGGPLTVTWSAKGFNQAFKMMSSRCANGGLSYWLR